jgi:hypothetical protein
VCIAFLYNVHSQYFSLLASYIRIKLKMNTHLRQKVLMHRRRYCCPILFKSERSRQIFVKLHNIKFIVIRSAYLEWFHTHRRTGRLSEFHWRHENLRMRVGTRKTEAFVNTEITKQRNKGPQKERKNYVKKK